MIKATKGWGPFKRTWFSICSAHQQCDDTCERCQVGGYKNDWMTALDGLVYNYHYKLWFRIHNHIFRK